MLATTSQKNSSYTKTIIGENEKEKRKHMITFRILIYQEPSQLSHGTIY
jgi:hypothetical protein